MRVKNVANKQSSQHPRTVLPGMLAFRISPWGHLSPWSSTSVAFTPQILETKRTRLFGQGTKPYLPGVPVREDLGLVPHDTYEKGMCLSLYTRGLSWGKMVGKLPEAYNVQRQREAPGFTVRLLVMHLGEQMWDPHMHPKWPVSIPRTRSFVLF